MRVPKNTVTVDTVGAKKKPGRSYDHVTLEMYERMKQTMRDFPAYAEDEAPAACASDLCSHTPSTGRG